MQKTIQLFEQDFARWGLHVPEADAAARKSGVVHEAGWHVLYDFGQDSHGEFLDYYAALRDGTDPTVTDDWHVRLYETGDRVQLPTVLEAYMYSRDPTPEELARCRRKFADPQAQAAPPKPASPRPASPPAALKMAAAKPAAPQPAAPQPAAPQPTAAPVAAPSPRPAPRPVTGAGTAGMRRPVPGGTPQESAIAASAPPSTHAPHSGSAAPRSATPGAQTAPAPSAATALGQASPASADIALEVGLDLALAGVEPASGGDTLASWLMTPAFGSAMIEPAMAAAPTPKPAPLPKPKPAAPADDDVQASDLLFVSESPPPRTSDRTSERASNPAAAITTDDDTFTISMSDDEGPDDVQDASQAPEVAGYVALGDVVRDTSGDAPAAFLGPRSDEDTGEDAGEDAGEYNDPARDSVVAATVEGLDHYHTPTRSSGRAGAALADDEGAASIPPEERRHSPAPNAMLTTDIAAVAGSFEPWWYRPTARRVAMVAAAVIAVILVGSAVSHFRSSPPSVQRAVAPAPDADPGDAAGAPDSAQPDDGSAPDTLPVASTPSSVTADPANPAAEDGIARPAGPQSLPPIQRSGTSPAPLGSGRTTAKAGSALP